MDIEKLGPRICIMGPSCSGKSTLAVQLGRKLNLPVLHLDQMAHKSGTNWERRPDIELVADHDKFIEGDHWIIEGNYSVCLPQRLARATDVIFLDVPVWRCLGRYVGRSLRGDRNRPGMLQGVTIDFGLALPWYLITQYPKNKPGYFAAFKAQPHLQVQILGR